MDVQSRRHQNQPGGLSRKLAAIEVAEVLELSAGVVPGHSRPIIDSLQQSMNVLISFEFDHREATCACCCEHINHRAI